MRRKGRTTREERENGKASCMVLVELHFGLRGKVSGATAGYI